VRVKIVRQHFFALFEDTRVEGKARPTSELIFLLNAMAASSDLALVLEQTLNPLYAKEGIPHIDLRYV
jgi:hypothetical protein